MFNSRGLAQVLLLAEADEVEVASTSADDDASGHPSVSKHWERVSNAIRVKAFGLKVRPA
jgi:hypothetical protein